MEERLPRSAPDALRFEPGVYVQQSAHGQGSAYLRGRTGQQTVMLFDGIRLNTSTYRQGPNQYFFTIDARSVRAIEVRRGGASTLYGSDAIGGTIDALPLEPLLDPSLSGLSVHPGFALRWASADGEAGGRVQLAGQAGEYVAFLVGTGYRNLGRLESGGRLSTPAGADNTPAGGWVPRFEDDGRTQLGTGFRELATDARVVARLGETFRLVGAVYDYRQFDAPRTDKCPPPEAPRNNCYVVEEQFRTLAYLSLTGSLGRVAERLRVALSYQLQHERHVDQRPTSFVENGGRDDVHTLGLLLQARTAEFSLARGSTLAVDYGADVYHDRLASTGWTTFTDLSQVVARSRGQYIDGSRYFWGGVFVQPELSLFAGRLLLRGGARLASASAFAPEEPVSGTRGVDRDWITVVGHGGIEFKALPWLSLLASVDRSYRAPNLDDLTSRQETGPGFQVENPDLAPEAALTVEGGLRLMFGRYLQAELWGYWARLSSTIERQPLPLAACPQATGRSCLHLINLDGDATVLGFEAIARAHLARRLTLRATLAWARGEGPSPALDGARVPLSRIPPLNGTVELVWRHWRGFYLGSALRWALAQDRLSLGDQSDARIPIGGTPGFAVVDLRAGYRLRKNLLVALTVENLGDAAYRYHGSSVNGAGRGVVLGLEGHL